MGVGGKTLRSVTAPPVVVVVVVLVRESKQPAGCDTRLVESKCYLRVRSIAQSVYSKGHSKKR